MRQKKSVTMYGLGHPEETEGMLSDMAGKGWKLEKIESYTYYFTMATPEEMEYRLVYTKDGIHQEQMTHYEKMDCT